MEPSTSMHKGSSSKSHCGQKRTGLPKWNPKHKIFLSHSGEQKEFVRQLCKDLEAETHQPFFDERSSSLMMGERFAPLIFEAARQCLVAVVVLSEAFLTSKWPMLELVEFVKAKRSHNPELKLFPLFYKLSPDDLKPECIESRWKDAWAEIITLAPDQVMPLDGTRNELSLSLCIEALSELCGANGLKFENFASKVAYREAIVKEISLLVAPILLDDISDVIGNERLCKVLAGMFVEDTSKDSSLHGTYKLGLYGMGGLGKTTMSRALCVFYHKHFNGRVFHVELGSRPPLDLQKLVLTKLLRINKDIVELVHMVHVGRKLLKDHMNRQPVFLVIDNIIDDLQSHKEALAYLEAGFHLGSKIMITSRSFDIVEELFPSHSNTTYCKVVASLSEEEARLLFLQRAAPQRKLETLTIEEHKILRKCLDQCEFSFENGKRQYHPLALQAMADYYHKHDHLNVLTWIEHLGDLDKLRLSNASSDVFGVLGLQFRTLALKEKLTFLDLCLYMNQEKFSVYFRDGLSWLEDIHEDTPTAVKFQLQSLKRSGIINYYVNKARELFITIHDLYREFAKWYVTEGEGSRWCIYYVGSTRFTPERQELGCVSHMMSVDSLPYVLKKKSPSAYEVQRIWLGNLKHATFLSKKIQEWCNVVVLLIYDCSNLRVLDLHGLSCLRHLELVGLPELESFQFANVQPHSSKGPNGTLESLQHVVLRGLMSLKRLPNFSLCTLLKTFWMLDCKEFLVEPSWFMGCSQLEYLNPDWNGQWQVEEFKLHTLTSLTSLQVCNVVVLLIYDCSNLRVLDLHGLSCLRHLELVGLPELESFHFAKLQPHSSKVPNGTLESLQHVVLRDLMSLKRLPNFSLCTLLKTFWMLDCKEFLAEPPWFMGCSQLEYSNPDWNGQWQVEEFKLHTLTSLTLLQVCNVVVLLIYDCSNLRVLDLHGLSCLRHLELVGLPELESFQFAKLQPHSSKVPNGTLESLQHVVLRGLMSLKQLPDFSLCTLLKTFWMLDCKEFLAEPPWFMGCSQLEYSNPDWNRQWQVEEFKLHTLTSLTLLQVCNVVVLKICECSNLRVLDLHGLSCLRHLELIGLPELESFQFANVQPHNSKGPNGTLESLQHVVLRGLMSLKQLPNFSLCTLLKTFWMLDCEEFLLEPPQFMGCLQLEDLNLDWNRQWRVEEFKLSTLTSLTSLQLCNQVGVSNWLRSFILRGVGFLTLTGLSNCSQLQNLKLVALPITNLLGLEKLTKLHELFISHCDFLRYIPDLSALIELKHVTMAMGPYQQFPREERLHQLRYLGCS